MVTDFDCWHPRPQRPRRRRHLEWCATTPTRRAACSRDCSPISRSSTSPARSARTARSTTQSDGARCARSGIVEKARRHRRARAAAARPEEGRRLFRPCGRLQRAGSTRERSERDRLAALQPHIREPAPLADACENISDAAHALGVGGRARRIILRIIIGGDEREKISLRPIPRAACRTICAPRNRSRSLSHEGARAAYFFGSARRRPIVR